VSLKTSLCAWLRPPYGLLAAFLAVTLGPALGLIPLGWRLLDQDRALAGQRIVERRENAADQVVAALQRELQASERDLAQLHAPAPEDDALLVEFVPSGMRAYPNNALLFYPSVPAQPDAPSIVYGEAEKEEFQRRDYEKAVASLTPLTRSPNRSIRAGAYLRMARNQRKIGQFSQALSTYAELIRYGETSIGGLPAELIARRARCAVLVQMNRQADLRKEAAEFYGLLRRGQWQLSQSAYDIHAEEAAAWLAIDRSSEAGALALAEAVAWLSDGRNLEPGGSGRRSVVKQNRLVTILWTRGRDGLRALVAGPLYLQRRWLSALSPLTSSLRVKVALKEMNPGSDGAIERASSATGLPWTFFVASTDVQAEVQQFAARRRLLLGGLALVAVVICAGSYFIARAFARELAVARLQSDFVSAVSHEFRTPLTSLRQLSEIFNEDRPLEEERRKKYYQALDRATARLYKLVEGLLDFGRMEAGAMVYRKTDLDVGTLVSSVVSEFQREAGDRGYLVELKTTDNLPAVHGDPEALGRALWNLLDNATKYSSECKTVWVEVEREGRKVAIRVRDRGMGIPAPEQQEILRKFVRGAAAAGIKGTGIGLAIVKHIVDAHGGALRLESAPGQGSTFSILLPVV
jgi:signal transduction histidine kinase